MARQRNYTRRSLRLLEDGLVSALIAGAANLMRWLGSLSVWINGVDKRPRPYLVQVVASLLSFPCFKLSNLCFKIAFRLQQRRLLALGSHCAVLGGENYALEFDDLGLNHRLIPKANERARHLASRFKARNHAADHQWVSHPNPPGFWEA